MTSHVYVWWLFFSGVAMVTWICLQVFHHMIGGKSTQCLITITQLWLILSFYTANMLVTFYLDMLGNHIHLYFKCPHASSRNGSSGQQGLRKDGHESRHILHEHDLHRRLHRHHHRPHHPPGKGFEGRVWKTAENRASQSCWRLLRSDQVSRRAAPPFRFGDIVVITVN